MPSRADRENSVSDAAAAHIDRDPATMPHRDPSPAPQLASTTDHPAASPHAAVPHERNDHQDSDRLPYLDAGIIPADLEEDEGLGLPNGETASAGSTIVTPSVYVAHTFEHGRRYQNFKNGCPVSYGVLPSARSP